MEETYIFYNFKDKYNDSLEDRARAKEKSLKSSGKTVYIKGIATHKEFLKEWNFMNNNGKEIESVSLYFHSNPKTLIIDAEGQAIRTERVIRTGRDVGGVLVKDLGVKNINTINLYTCNSGHLDYINKNLGYNFAKYQNVKTVSSWDGSMKWDDKGKGILASNQKYFHESRLGGFRFPKGNILYEKTIEGHIIVRVNGNSDIIDIFNKPGITPYEWTEATA